jgi:amino acid transporter
MSIQLVTQGVLGGAMSANKDAPLAAVAGISFGKAGAVLIVVAASLAMLGNLSGEVLTIPRILFAGARDKLMPKPLAKVHPRFSTPWIAVIFYAALDFIFSATGQFKQLAVLASATLLIIYLGVVLASVKLRRKEIVTNEKTFRVPGGIIVPLFASAGIIWLLSSLSKKEMIGTAIFILIISIIYMFILLAKKKQRPAEI